MNAEPATEEVVNFLHDELHDEMDRFHFLKEITQADFGKVNGQWVLIIWMHERYCYTRVTGKRFLGELYDSLSAFCDHVLGSSTPPRLIVGRVNCYKRRNS